MASMQPGTSPPTFVTKAFLVTIPAPGFLFSSPAVSQGRRSAWAKRRGASTSSWKRIRCSASTTSFRGSQASPRSLRSQVSHTVMLSWAYYPANIGNSSRIQRLIGFDTAENEPCKVCPLSVSNTFRTARFPCETKSGLLVLLLLLLLLLFFF